MSGAGCGLYSFFLHQVHSFFWSCLTLSLYHVRQHLAIHMQDQNIAQAQGHQNSQFAHGWAQSGPNHRKSTQNYWIYSVLFNPFAAAWQVGIVEPEACAEQPAALSSREPEPLCAEGPTALLVAQSEVSVQGKAIDEDQEYMFDLNTLIFENKHGFTLCDRGRSGSFWSRNAW